MAEVVELMRGVNPLSDAEAEPFRKLLGIQEQKSGGWKRWLGGSR